MSAPTMQERKACWGARDEFWQCLEAHAEDAARCEELRLAFESRCPQQWVSGGRGRPHEGRAGTAERLRAAGGRARGGEGTTASPGSPINRQPVGAQSWAAGTSKGLKGTGKV